MDTPDLVLLTAEFPFGTASETFLEVELPILADRFRRVFILPSGARQGQRPLPGNAELVRMGWLTAPSLSDRVLGLVDPRSAVTLRASQGTYRELLQYRRRPRVYLDVLARNILKARELTRFVHARSLNDALFYDYWFENSTLALSLCRMQGTVRTAVARAHNYDLYDAGFGGIPVPFRQAKARGLDAVFPVSRDGERYLAEHVPALKGKMSVHRLGVLDPGRGRPEAGEAIPLVLSCAALVPEKRIHLIPEVLAAIGAPVRWVHVGDGPERGRVIAAARRHLDEESWRLAGEMTNANVLEFYGSNPVGALLSVSSSEGVPVSMMEAQSYGVPVVSCEVGAVSEIVTPDTGLLVPLAASPQEIATALAEALRPGRFQPAEVRRSWRGRYDGPRNYAAFADVLLQLASARPPVAMSSTDQRPPVRTER